MNRQKRIAKAKEMAKGAASARESVVAVYEERWGPLGDRRRRNLIVSPIVAMLARQSIDAVRVAVEQHRHLSDIYEAVAGRRYEPPSNDIGYRVWISGGGTVFHRGPDCEAMLDGKRKAQSVGHFDRSVSAIDTVEALARGREACLVCIGREPRYRQGVLDNRFSNADSGDPEQSGIPSE